METGMRRRTLLLAVIIASCLTVFLLWIGGQFSQATAPTLPDASEIENISAELFETQRLKPAVPSFVVDSRYYAIILSALRPAQRYDYPDSWDNQSLGAFIIKSKAGTTHRVKFCAAGHNPTTYLLDGVHCIRGGEYYTSINPREFVCVDEGIILQSIVWEIYQTQKTGRASDELQTLIQFMERSRGERQPKQ